MSGIFQSRKTRSKVWPFWVASDKMEIASVPVVAVETAKPRVLRKSLKISRAMTLSSTARADRPLKSRRLQT